MAAPLDHERPLLLLLGERDEAADGFRALLAHPDVRAWHLPPPWALERAGLDLLGALPELRTLSADLLPRALAALARQATPELLDALSRQLWREVDEQVRGYYLKRGALETLASLVRVAPRSRDLEPPPSFVEDRVHEHGFVLEYRLARAEEPADPTAPPEEGSLVYYPFDPANQAARREALLPEGRGVVLEAFAYAAGRARHRRVLEDVASQRGWRVVDPEV
jgi:hypothetical protein